MIKVKLEELIPRAAKTVNLAIKVDSRAQPVVRSFELPALKKQSLAELQRVRVSYVRQRGRYYNTDVRVVWKAPFPRTLSLKANADGSRVQFSLGDQTVGRTLFPFYDGPANEEAQRIWDKTLDDLRGQLANHAELWFVCEWPKSAEAGPLQLAYSSTW